MGIIKGGILGGFSGKVGAVIGTSWKGIQVMKGIPASVANPNTAGQQEQRGAFKKTVYDATILLPTFIKAIWDRQAHQMSGYNLFVKKNVERVKTATGAYSLVLQCSIGKLNTANLIQTKLNSDSVEFAVEYDLGRYGKPTDMIKVVAYSMNRDGSLNEVVGSGEALAVSGLIVVSIPDLSTVGREDICLLPFVVDLEEVNYSNQGARGINP